MSETATKTSQSFSMAGQCTASIANNSNPGSLEQAQYSTFSNINQDASALFSNWNGTLNQYATAVMSGDSNAMENLVSGPISALSAQTYNLFQGFLELANNSPDDSSSGEFTSQPTQADLEIQREIFEMEMESIESSREMLLKAVK